MAERSNPDPILRDPLEQEVAPLELLFDLVFVLGVSQLTRHLSARPSWRGAAETFDLYIPMFAVWAYTSWAATLYSLNHPRARWMVVAVMIVGMTIVPPAVVVAVDALEMGLVGHRRSNAVSRPGRLMSRVDLSSVWLIFGKFAQK